MSPQERDALWRRYLSARRAGGTQVECRYAFDAWWKHEKADALKTTKADLKAAKKAHA